MAALTLLTMVFIPMLSSTTLRILWILTMLKRIHSQWKTFGYELRGNCQHAGCVDQGALAPAFTGSGGATKQHTHTHARIASHPSGRH